MALYLKENLTFDAARMEVINESTADGKGKNLYMKGIFIQGGVKNHNERVYPVNEIEKAVSTLNEQIKGGYSVLGEVDHPDDLKINLDRVSHLITDMWMDGPNGFGKLKILPTPMGLLVTTMLESGVKLGVSSRGMGSLKEINEGTLEVQPDFELVCWDFVSNPSTHGAFMNPISLNESIQSMSKFSKLDNIINDILRA